MNPVASFPDPQYQARQDEEHLRLLSIFYYIVAGLIAVTGLIFIFHIIMGLAIVSGGFGPPSGTVTITPNTFPSAPTIPSVSPTVRATPAGPPAAVGWLFVSMGAFALTLSETLAALTLCAGRCLAKRTKKTFVQVVAALLCLHIPIGTLLGVFTFIVLSRPSVAFSFDSHPNP